MTLPMTRKQIAERVATKVTMVLLEEGVESRDVRELHDRMLERCEDMIADLKFRSRLAWVDSAMIEPCGCVGVWTGPSYRRTACPDHPAETEPVERLAEKI
jgi:hypothetical protein